MKRLLRPLLNRVARLLGVTELQAIATELRAVTTSTTNNITAAIASQETLRREWGEVERLIFKTFEDELASRMVHLMSELAKVESQILRTEAHLANVQLHLEMYVQEHTESFVLERLNAAQELLRDYSDTRDSAIQTSVDNVVAALRREIDLLRSMARHTSPSPVLDSEKSQLAGSAKKIDDALYVALEDHFRGPPTTVRARQELYLPYVQDVVNSDFPLIDFGCGRGEWLEILKENGIAARGFDANVVCVDECVNKGLTVEIGDLLDILQKVPTASAGAVTFFQVFEHLEFQDLETVIRACLRVLKPGGVMIAEVPNSENLSVGSSTFWIDPTHQRPLHPEVLRFLARQIGFSRVDGIYSTPLRPEPVFEDSSSSIDAMRDIYRALFGPADFAVIAHV